jgi:hypothetical protein
LYVIIHQKQTEDEGEYSIRSGEKERKERKRRKRGRGGREDIQREH